MMARYNPNRMMLDGGGETIPNNPTLSPEQGRIAVMKLQSNQPLTDAEKRFLGIPVADTTVADTTVTDTPVEDTTEEDTTAADTAAADAAAQAIADAKAAADKAAADKAAADAATAAAKTAAEIAAAKAAQLAAEKALADARAAANKAAADKAAQAKATADAVAAAGKGERQSAYDLLFTQFKQYGLESLVTPLQNLIISGTSPSEFTIKLRETESYKKRFAANADRIKNGLKAVSEAEYLGLEDQYQNIMRNYGLPAEYYTRGEMGTQEGFQKFIANDVSATELEDRVMTAQNRVLNSNPEVLASLKSFYPDITNGDILAYTLNPTKALSDIKRKVTAAEIGGAAVQSGLNLGDTPEQRALYAARAAELGAAGITKAQAQQGYGTIGGGLQRGSQLAAIYGESPYTQTTAEKEVFGLAGKTEAEKQRKKLTGLEKATFSGQTGISSGALARDRAGAY